MWSSTYLLLSWRRLTRGKESRLDHVFHGLLMAKVQTEGLATDLAQFLLTFALFKITPEALQLEKSSGGEAGHNEVSNEDDAVESEGESTIVSELSYYKTTEIPGVIAIVRYYADDDEGKAIGVGEDSFLDDPDEFCRVQSQVQEALLEGINVAMMSHLEPEAFPEINQFLTDDEDEETAV